MQSLECMYCSACFVRACGLASHLRKHEILKPPKPVKSHRAPTGFENKKKEEDSVKESRDVYFPLPPESRWAPSGGDPGFPERVEVDFRTPLMEQSKNLLAPLWLVFVEKKNPVNSFVRPEPSEEPKKDTLEPPKLEDFYKIPGCSFGEERHPVEAIDFYERALEKYDRMMKARKRAQREGPPPVLRVRDYLRRKAEIEESRECPDCPYKNSNLTKFRAHRDRHELGGLVKCSECNYGSHSRIATKKHMFFDHYLNDVKVLEGLPSSDSEILTGIPRLQPPKSPPPPPGSPILAIISPESSWTATFL